MEPRLFQQQTQKQILSPQIRQYLKLLQLPLLQLTQAVETELAENPVLEETPSTPPESSSPAEESAQESSARDKETEELRIGESFEHYDKLDENFHSDFEYPPFSSDRSKEVQRKRDFQETLITRPEGLTDFLLWQIRFLDLDESERKIAEEIIGNIDEEGYLRATLDEIAKSCQTDSSEIEKILPQIQGLDPPGIGARNLQEALLIQLKKKTPQTEEISIAKAIVHEHLQLLEKQDWHHIAKVLAVGISQVKAAASIIAHLEPKPGRTFYTEEPIAITPDATVTFSDEEDGGLKIEIHEESTPELRVNPYYRRLLRSKHADEKTKAFLREKMHRAVGFLKALKLRKSTLHEITEKIVQIQSRFFENGFSHLVPLRLKDIATGIGIHESTVSRAIQGKYISTPQGTIPYKSFFSTKLDTVSGEAESQKSIMERIRSLIELEDAKKPLSDQQIVKQLQNEGIVIARRTVAKYRELLKILPSRLRKNR